VKRIFVGLSLFLAACASGGAAISMNNYYEVPIGATQRELVDTMGEPVATHRKEEGAVEYEYVEKWQSCFKANDSRCTKAVLLRQLSNANDTKRRVVIRV
jgi:hypothetical protein